MSQWKQWGVMGGVLSLMGCQGVEEPVGPFQPSAPIEILVDAQGVSHVYGQTDQDAMYGAGYRVATERLYEMEMLKRLLTGRLSEVLGEEMLFQDRQLRIFDVPKWGKADADLMRQVEPEMASWIEAWRAGVNARIEEVRAGTAERPFGFRADEYDFLPELWEPDDPYVVLKGVELGLGRTVEFEIAITLISRLFPEAMAAVDLFKPAHDAYGLPQQDRPAANSGDGERWKPTPATLDPEHRDEMFKAMAEFALRTPAMGNSNNWALDGQHTDNGRPLIAGDPHLNFDMMGAMYPLHINSAEGSGRLDTAGFAFPGVAGIALGHNRDVVWTQTTAFGDVMDVWEVERVEGGLQLGDEVVASRVRTETFTLRAAGQAVGEGETVSFSYEDVPKYGVIVPLELLPVPVGGPYLVNWTGFKAQTTRWPLALNTMGSLDEFDAVLESMPELNQSTVAADANGIAGGNGLEIPKRSPISADNTPWTAMPGANAETFWTGEMLPASYMPRTRGGDRGWIATANNDPFGFTANGQLDDDPFYYGSFFAPGYRAHRIESELTRLTAEGGVSIEDMMTLQMDVHSSLADDLLPVLESAWHSAQTDPDLAAYAADDGVAWVVQLLTEDWDRQMSGDSAGALAFQTFLHYSCQGVLKDDISISYDFAMSLQSIFVIKLADNAMRGRFANGEAILQEGANVIVLEAVKKTAALILERFGALDATTFRWDDLKTTSFHHSLGVGMAVYEVPSEGGEDTVNVSENIVFDPDADAWSSNYVAAERTVAGFDEQGQPTVWVNYPVPTNADLTAEGAMAPLEDYISGTYRRLLFDRAEIEAATVERIELK